MIIQSEIRHMSTGIQPEFVKEGQSTKLQLTVTRE
jgi:hypothetical protein